MDNIPELSEWDVLDGALKLAFAFLGAVAVGFIIYGGITYITSSGDPQKAMKAKRILIYAIVGLVIVLLAFTIENFIGGAIA